MSRNTRFDISVGRVEHLALVVAFGSVTFAGSYALLRYATVAVTYSPSVPVAVGLTALANFLLFFCVALTNLKIRSKLRPGTVRFHRSIVWLSWGTMLAAGAFIFLTVITSIGITTALARFVLADQVAVSVFTGCSVFGTGVLLSRTADGPDDYADQGVRISASRGPVSDGPSEPDSGGSADARSEVHEAPDRSVDTDSAGSSTNLRPQDSPGGSGGAGDSSTMTDTRFDWKESTGVAMTDVGGMEELKAELDREIVKPLVDDSGNADALDITVPNVLLYGPPGTGKTFLAKALATEIGLPFVRLSGSDVQSKWINESAQIVNQLFEEANYYARRHGGAIIFFDELDSVLSNRGQDSSHGEDTKVVNEFLTTLEQTGDNNVVFIGATNRYEELDDAAIRSGRIDRKYKVGLPDEDTRVKILETQLDSRGSRISERNIEQIARNADGYSAADLAGVVESAAKEAAFERDDDTIIAADITNVDPSLGDRVTLDGPPPGSETPSGRESSPGSAEATDDSNRDALSPSAEEFHSTYRIIGFADEARRMALYDVHRDDVAWVNTVGYDDAIRSVLEEVDSGNVVEAGVTADGDENEYWNLLDIEIVDDTVLYFGETEEYVPGPVDGIWEEREEGDDLITAGRSDEAAETILYEIQLQANEVTTGDGEVLDVFPNLQRGELLTEPFYEGNGCDYLPDGARSVIVVNAADKPFVAMYLFPDKGEKFEEVWGTLYDHING